MSSRHGVTRTLAGLCAGGALFMATGAVASPDYLVFKEVDQESRLAVDELREQANLRFTFYDP